MFFLLICNACLYINAWAFTQVTDPVPLTFPVAVLMGHGRFHRPSPQNRVQSRKRVWESRAEPQHRPAHPQAQGVLSQREDLNIWGVKSGSACQVGAWEWQCQGDRDKAQTGTGATTCWKPSWEKPLLLPLQELPTWVSPPLGWSVARSGLMA